MNPREKRLAIIFGIGVGCAALYYLVNAVYIAPVEAYTQQISADQKTKAELDALVDSEMPNAKTWQGFINRTFSDDDAVAFDKFSSRLKETATLYGFDSALITKISKQTAIGDKTDIKAIKYEITVKDDYKRVIELLRGLYDAPYISQVTDLTLTPDPGAGRNVVRLDCRVATPVLPKVPPKETEYFDRFVTMEKLDGKAPVDAWRDDVLPSSAYTVALNNHNIFKAFEPAPRQQVIVENLDLKMVGVEVAFQWEGKETSAKQAAIQSGKQSTFFGEGDLVELKGSYADGTVFKQKHSFASGKPWSYRVAKHSVPPPPPPAITLVVNNQDDEEARYTLTITDNENQTRVIGPIVLDAGAQSDLGAFKETKQVKIAATYASGKPVAQKVFSPRTAPQTYMIPRANDDVATPDVGGPVVVDDHVNDPEGSSQHVVKALLAYDDANGEYVQEMLVEGPDGLETIKAGEWGKVDGDGVLRGVCPLGGIVQMKTSGNYYIYLRGKPFAERELLPAENDEQLASAIMEWSKSPSAIGG